MAVGDRRARSGCGRSHLFLPLGEGYSRPPNCKRLAVEEDAMRFRILGPLQVDVDGRTVALGGPKPRTLLAALLVQRGQVVSVDRLIDALWPGRPPSGAVNALRAYVSRLRTALEGRISYRAPGYRVQVADDEFDAAEFEASAAVARAL